MSTDHERTTDHTSADAAIAAKERELREAAYGMVACAKHADKKMNRRYEPGSYITVDHIDHESARWMLLLLLRG